jgi:D-tyrosyl-tRNA(Tyr) deacylase
MKVILQRVKEARVTVEGEVVGAIESGLLLLVGMAAGDAEPVMRLMAGKIANLRIFEDDQGKMNLSVLDTGGSALAVSQFTLFADCRKGRRPSFTGAAPAEEARVSFEQFVTILRETGLPVETGKFQAMMDVSLINAGPVTIILDSNEL